MAKSKIERQIERLSQIENRLADLRYYAMAIDHAANDLSETHGPHDARDQRHYEFAMMAMTFATKVRKECDRAIGRLSTAQMRLKQAEDAHD